MRVYVAVYHNGENDITEMTRVFNSMDSVKKWQREIAGTNWDSKLLGAMPDDNDVMLDTYWDYVTSHYDEWFLWDDCEVEP